MKKKFLSMVMILTMVMSMFSGVDLWNVSVKAASGYAVGTSVYFGAYYQNFITNEDIIYTLDDTDFNKDGTVTYKGVKYARAKAYGRFHYAKANDSIEWLVLGESGGYYTLLSKKVLFMSDYQGFWSESQLRDKLNDDFYNTAFTKNEQKDMKAIVNVTKYHPYNDAYIDKKPAQYIETQDKVSLLDSDEVQSLDYGFDDTDSDTDTRIAYTTKYAGYDETAVRWWLRGPGGWHYGNMVQSFVSVTGKINTQYFTYSYGVRPVIKVKANSVLLSDQPFDRDKVKNVTNKSNSITLNVTGTYKDGQTKKVLKDTEKYSDGYFTKSSSKIQGGLAKLSMLAASSVYNKKYSNKLIKACKFNKYKYVKKTPKKNNNDTISYEVGIRNVDGTNIVAVWVKGTGGDYEWVSNWNLGKGNTHTGFSIAEEKMYKEIKSYLSSNKVGLNKNSKTKVWITGHSRGAAIANLFAKHMNNVVGKNNVYAYTFATPRVSVLAKKKGYENIFNYLNPGDFVTEVAPKKWGYKRYGVDITLTESKKKSMEKKFKKLSKAKYNGFGVQGKNSLVKAFLKYAGNKKSGYYKKKPNKTPEFFCKYGLGYVLGGQLKSGLKNCIAACKSNNDAKKVMLKMVVDGKVNNKFGFAHTQLGYIAWLDVMY